MALGGPGMRQMTYLDGAISEWEAGGQISILVGEGNDVLPVTFADEGYTNEIEQNPFC